MNVQIPAKPTDTDLSQDEPGLLTHLRNYLIGGGALLLVLGGYWYYNHNATPAAGRNVRGLAAPVRIAVVQQRDMAVVERNIGTVVANSSVSVTARVQGQLTKAYFKEGQMVKAGDLLFQIDPAPFQAAYDAMLATLAGAKSTAERSAILRKQNAIAAQTDDQNQSAYMQAKANAEAARLNLEFCEIRSPINGKTGPILLQPGNLVSVNGLTAPLVTITQIQPIKISFFLPQTDLPRIEARQKAGGLIATVDQSDTGGSSFSVPVDFISNAVNATSGTIELRATYDNKDSALVPGQLVNVIVQLSDIPKATIVPHDALTAGPDSQFIYRVSGGRAEQIPVNVLFDDSKNVAVTGDVKPGDNVIVDGQLEVVPGGKVQVVQGAQAGQKPAGGKRRKKTS
jgi:multidrug efflux system membrane fusion protein